MVVFESYFSKNKVYSLVALLLDALFQNKTLQHNPSCLQDQWNGARDSTSRVKNEVWMKIHVDMKNHHTTKD
jgi:hypothetical protein